MSTDSRDADLLARRQVAVLLDAPGDVAVAMFAAWSAGLGILPLPVELPDARIRDMVADCAPALLLTSARLADRAHALVAGQAVPPRVVVFESAVAAPRRPAVAQDPCGPAFTVYTSGTTGRPKGVLIRQDQVSRLVAWSGPAWGFEPSVRIAQTLSLGFDFGLQELFTSLPHGGCVVVPGAADRGNAQAYARFLRRTGVTVLFTTPSYADELIAAGQPLPDLRFVLLGGEVLKRATVTGVRGLVGPQCRIVNGYGPTEATVNCLAYEVPADVPDAELPAVLPVGTATAAGTIRLLGADGSVVPAGAIGEIVIGGPGVADGYLHRPELTAQRFRPGPAGLTYRTGDLAYATPDGYVVVGRNDRQVKVRGFRVELEEVEHVLREVPGVRSAAVFVTGEPARLVAALSGDALDDIAIRRHLATRLLAAMVPDQLLMLEGFPMTRHGKVDEAALRRLADENYLPILGRTASAAEVEAAICRTWAAALALPEVPPDTNVFDAGAHSLVVTRVHHQLEVTLGLNFAVHLVFEYPRPKDLARLLSVRRDTSHSPQPPTADALPTTTRKE